MASRVGTLAWAERTGGALRERERWAQLASGIAAQIRALSPARRRAVGLDAEAIGQVELPSAPPDSAIAARAEELCATVSSASLHHHCARTFLWGALLAQRDGLTYDAELLYVSALLHDLGLTDHAAPAPDSHCFALDGARAARAFAEAEGWPAERRDAMAEAIALHLNTSVGLEHGSEAHLLNAGAAFDVIGARRRALPTPVVDAVVERYPRLGFKREIAQLMAAELAVRPRGRAAFLHRRVGFGRMVAAAPFEE